MSRRTERKPEDVASHQGGLSRRRFMVNGAIALGLAIGHSPVRAFSGKRPAKAADRVPLNETGFKTSRLGMGTGGDNGEKLRQLGGDKVDRLIRHGYDRGLRFIDTADRYQTHPLVRRAIQGLPREDLWIQSKIPWEGIETPRDVLDAVDRYRRELNLDSLDSLLVHCVLTRHWEVELKPVLEGIDRACARGWVRLKGVSGHGLPALAGIAASDWPDLTLVRLNPQGHHCDGKTGEWAEPGLTLQAVPLIQRIHERGKGVVAAKLIGNGAFTSPADRRRAVRYVMTRDFVDAAVIGFASPGEIDEAIALIDGKS